MGLNLKTFVDVENDVSTSGVTGHLSTSGAEIVDAATGEVVRLLGVNWHGAEGFNAAPGGLWARNYRDMMDQMMDSGFNLIRLPISPAVLTEGTGTAVNRNINPSLADASALEVIDAVIDYADEIGMRVLLDMHRRTAGVGKQEDGLWFSDEYTEADLISDWQTIASRYAGNPTVIGADIFNEPSGKTRWSADDPNIQGPQYAWSDAAERIGDAIHTVNPDWLIFVEGNHIVGNKFYWVGGNLLGVADDPVDLNQANKLVYSPHDYPFGVRKVPWLEGADAAQMIDNWDTHWGYIYDQGIAPVVIGETGSRFRIAEDLLYMETLETYLANKAASSPGGDGGTGLIWWTWGANSFDTGGILESNWIDVIPQKLDAIDSLATDPLPTNASAIQVLDATSTKVELSVDASSPWHQTYLYETMDLNAVAGQDYIAETGVLHLSPNRTVASTELTIIADDVAETEEEFLFRVSTLDGAPLGLEKISILDDDNGAAGQVADPKVFVGGVDRSPGVWTTLLELKDVPAPGDGFSDWSTTLYSDLFDLSTPLKGSMTQTGANTYQLTSPEKNGTWTTSLTATLKVSVEEFIGLETALLFADPIEPIVDPVPPEAYSPTGQLLTGNPDIKVTIETQQLYGTEFFAKIRIKNDTENSFDDWELKFRGPFDVRSTTKVSVLEQDDEWIFVQAPTWNNDLAPGEEFVFGLNADLDIDPGDHIVAFDTFYL